MITRLLPLFILGVILFGCTNNVVIPTTQKINTIDENREKEFIKEFPNVFEETFALLGHEDSHLNDFKSVTFYVGTSTKIDDLDSIFRDYAKRIGTDHIAIFLKYGSQNYIKRLDEIKCFHLSPFEVPAIIYVDLQSTKCYYFTHSNGKLLADALMLLSESIDTKSNFDSIKVEFDLRATIEDLIVAFPALKPLRDLLLRISQHIFLRDNQSENKYEGKRVKG